MAISAEPFSPYMIPRHDRDQSEFALGWNAHLRGESRNNLPNEWQRNGWDAAYEYATDLKVPIPCPADYVRYPVGA